MIGEDDVLRFMFIGMPVLICGLIMFAAHANNKYIYDRQRRASKIKKNSRVKISNSPTANFYNSYTGVVIGARLADDEFLIKFDGHEDPHWIDINNIELI